MIMFYAKKIDEKGEIIYLHEFPAESFPAEPLLIEITEEEYNAILEEWAANVPDPDEISDSEALAIILGVTE